MSSTNKTANLELSQYVGSDKPTYLVDYNGDMAKIDAGYAAVKSKADATDLAVSGLTSTVSGLSSTVSDQGSAITGLRTDTDSNTGSINTINSLIGNGEPTTTDKTIIGAINELAAEIPSGGVSADDVSYDNTNSGLTADDVQEAIDEVVTREGDLSSLATTVKTSLVAAINEVAGGGGLKFEVGSWFAQTAGAGVGVTQAITFTGTYTNPPIVLTSISTNDSDTASGQNTMSCWTTAVTNGGCTLHAQNSEANAKARIAYLVISTD